MHFSKLKQVFYHITVISRPHHYYYPRNSIGPRSICIFPISQNQHDSEMRAGSGVDLIDIHPSPSNVKAGSNFELLATVVNNSPDTIMLPAGRCDSPLTAFFMRNVVIRQDQFQGCTATSSPFELNPEEEVTVAGPVPGTIYQAIKAGETPATATVYYLTENGQPGNVTKPFVFTIS